MPLIAPSVLAADFTNLTSEVRKVNESDADWFHLDVMDGRFVPNISFGQFIVKAIESIAEKPLDLHLMIVEPEKYVPEFAAAGADVITVHYEACPHLHRNIHQIKDLGKTAGVAINPHTPVQVLRDVINDIDMVCIMSVNPGFGGQKFIQKTYDKVRQLRQMAAEHQCENLLIEIDGGVSMANATELIQAGADVLVAGSAVFRADDPQKVIRDLKNAGQHTTQI